MIKLYKGDCLVEMNKIEDKSVDMILCDLPYGTTECEWDVALSFDKLWEQYKRVIKDNGAIVLFAKQPFTSKLILSNEKMYKYNLIWKKDNHDNPLMAKKRFLNITEDIVVFYKKQCPYNPQGLVEYGKITKQGATTKSLVQKNRRGSEVFQQYTNYPRNILEFKRDFPMVHPTQKPVALLEYLIKTFTNEGALVLDNCMGSGSAGVAAKNLNRDFIGIEMTDKYYDIAKGRMNYND